MHVWAVGRGRGGSLIQERPRGEEEVDWGKNRGKNRPKAPGPVPPGGEEVFLGDGDTGAGRHIDQLLVREEMKSGRKEGLGKRRGGLSCRWGRYQRVRLQMTSEVPKWMGQDVWEAESPGWGGTAAVEAYR